MTRTPAVVPTTAGGPLQDRFLRPTEAADFLRISPKTLANWRCSGGGPAYVHVSRNVVGYLLSDLLAWLKERRAKSTTQAWATGLHGSQMVAKWIRDEIDPEER